MTRLSTPATEMEAEYCALVVGSGYGGGVAASRLARAGLKVALLERGAERHPGEFPDEPLEAATQLQAEGQFGRIGRRSALFDLRVGEDINVLVGCGLGGTSLINANVALEADPRVFDDPAWPGALRRGGEGGALQEGYRRARAMLEPRPYPDDGAWPTLNKLEAMRSAAAALGAKLERPPINVRFEAGYNAAGVWQPACNLCGDCCSGCNTGAKSTTLMNYLPDAAAFGAKLFCNVRVRSVERRSDGRWNVLYRLDDLGREAFDGTEQRVSARIVVLAAGTLGSTEILLRSRERGLSLSGQLGARFGGNGDVLAFGYNNDVPIDGIGLGRKSVAYDWRDSKQPPVGPTIAGLIDLRATDDLEQGMVIEEGAIPGGLAGFLPPIMVAAANALGADTDEGDDVRERARELESLVLGPYRGAVAHSQTFLAMSHDGAVGRMALSDDRLTVRWPGVGDQPGFERVAANLRRAVGATGGTYVPNPIWTDLTDKSLVTVHPLGGCSMGEDAGAGVVDDRCRVFAGPKGRDVHEGLYVCDGSVIPRSLGVNPLLTISAIAERAMMKLAEADGLAIVMGPAPRAPDDQLREPIGLRFTEKMKGSVRSLADGTSSPAHFVLTVVAEDAGRLIGEEEHVAAIVGTVHVPALSPEPLTVAGGRFNLFTRAAGASATKHMLYHLPLAAANGRRYLFSGRKDVRDDRGFDVWSDTSTLFVTIHDGPDASGPVLFDGELHIAPGDFVRQLATTRVINAPSLRTGLGVLARFTRFFAAQLIDTYAAPAPASAPGEATGLGPETSPPEPRREGRKRGFWSGLWGWLTGRGKRSSP